MNDVIFRIDFLKSGLFSLYLIVFVRVHHFLKRPDTYDLNIFVRTFEKSSGRLRNRQDVQETVRRTVFDWEYMIQGGLQGLFGHRIID
jgi:hypothetical protein